MTEEIKTNEGIEKETKDQFIRRITSGGITEKDIPDSARENWTRSVLGMTPFSHSMSIMDGKIHVVFSEPSPEFRNIYRLLSGRIPNDMFMTLTGLSILLYLREINGEFNLSFEPPRDLLKLAPAMQGTPEAIADMVNFHYSDWCAKIPSAIARMLPTLWAMYSSMVAWFTENDMPDSF